MGPADITIDCQPKLAAGVRLSFDETRKTWMVLAPERVFMLDDIAGEILQRCTGACLSEIVQDLAAKFDAPKQAIEEDVKELLADLVVKGVLDL
ncbi:MAG: pyrroloquinoline quinone biosynthesis peptide chaperone PqqD [Sneathiella sp.]|nr:pyrroloquinoline quinone biosynthesis peptide chaperone PqqD [Sneathiella sp.]